MTFDHRVEVAEVVGAVVGLGEIDFGDGHGAPFFAAGERAAALIVNGGIHPAVIVIHEGAADEEDVILAGTGLGEQRIAAPHGPRDDFRAVLRQFAGGNFKDGFIGSGVSSVLSPAFGAIPGLNRTVAGRTAVAAVIGGTASELTGGKFANGAMSAAFTHLFNEELLPALPQYVNPEGYATVGDNPFHWDEPSPEQELAALEAFYGTDNGRIGGLKRMHAGHDFIMVSFNPQSEFYGTNAWGQMGTASWYDSEGNYLEGWVVASGGNATSASGLANAITRIPDGTWYARKHTETQPPYINTNPSEAFYRHGYSFKFAIPTPGTGRGDILFHPSPAFTSGCVGFNCDVPSMTSFYNRMSSATRGGGKIPVIVQ